MGVFVFVALQRPWPMKFLCDVTQAEMFTVMSLYGIKVGLTLRYVIFADTLPHSPGS